MRHLSSATESPLIDYAQRRTRWVGRWGRMRCWMAPRPLSGRPQPRPLLLALLCLLLPLVRLQAQTTSRYTQVAAGQSHSLALRADGTLWVWGANNSGQLGNGGGAGSLLPGLVATPAAALPGTTWTSVVAGPGHTLARRSDGNLWAWGLNNEGQLGDGTITTRLSPVLVPIPAGAGAGTSWTQVSTRENHTLALRSDGTLWAWGSNAAGQLGDGSTTSRLTAGAVPTPAGAPAGATYSQVAVGQRHTLALRSDGTLWAWGSNVEGQLGDGTTTSRLVPTAVTTPAGAGAGSTWAQVAAALNHTVALRSDGSLWAWGDNSDGRLGVGSNIVRSTLPVAVVTPATAGAGTRWTQLACGHSHTVALRSDGSLWSWGFNSAGQLGDNSISNRNAPVRETTNNAWSAVSASQLSSLAVLAGTGLVYGTGFNGQGQLGNGTTITSRVYLASAAPVLATRSAAASRLAVYPNPARGQCQLPALSPAATLHLTDGQGRLVRSQPAAPTLNLAGLAPGLYLLRVQQAGQPVRTARLVVE